MTLHPLDDRILVEPEADTGESKSAGGIIIPDTAKEKPRTGIVRGVGTDEKVVKNIKVGDKVLYGKYSGDEFEVEGKKLLIVKFEDVLAVVK